MKTYDFKVRRCFVEPMSPQKESASMLNVRLKDTFLAWLECVYESEKALSAFSFLRQLPILE